MARGISLLEAAAIMRSFNREKDEAVIRGLDMVGRMALRFAVTEFMQGLGQGKNARPPNPPPGPLGIRSGNLRRAYHAVPARRDRGIGWTVGLTVDLAQAPYGLIHERGGTIRHPGSSGKLQVFMPRAAFGGGRPVFAMKTKPHPIHIPARPVMQPAMNKAATFAPQEVERQLDATVKRLFG